MDKQTWRRKFPNRIKEILEAEDINQRELAEKTNLTETSVSRYVNGNRIPTVITVINMANALGVSVNKLIDF